MTQAYQNDIEVLVARLLNALQGHDPTACAALFTHDGLILSPYGPPARGRDAIAAVHQSWFDEGEKNKQLKLLDAGASETIGYCVLAYAGEYLQPDGSHAPHRGRSVNVLRRGGDGEWLIHISSMTVDAT